MSVSYDAGTLAVSELAADEVTLRYTAAAGYASGTLYVLDRIRGVIEHSESVSGSGTVTITGLRQSALFVAWVIPQDTEGNIGNATIPLVFRTPADLMRDGQPVIVKYRTERTDWRTYVIGSETKRANIPAGGNGRGYEFRLRIENASQNSRLILRGIRCQIRSQTRGDKAET